METRAAVDSFLLDREGANRSAWTIEWYTRKLLRFATRYPELPEAPAPIREFLAKIAGEDETKHGYFRAVRALYNFVHREWGFPLGSSDKRVDANPIKRVTAPRVRPKVMRSLSLKELHQLLNAPNGCREPKWHLRDLAIITLLADTGTRLGEALLTWDRLNGDSICVNGKTGEREVPILPETRQMLEKLRQWNQAHFGPNPYVFLGKKGPLTPHGLQQAVERAFRRAGLNGPRSSPHTLRHTFGRNWLAGGGDLRSLQILMGHARITTTEKYTALISAEVFMKHRQFSPVRTQARLAQGALWEEERGGNHEHQEEHHHSLQYAA